MKLSEIKREKKKKNQPKKLKDPFSKSMITIFKDAGISIETLVSTAMELYVPHPGVETKDVAEKVFLRELKHALDDPNLCILIYSGMLLEKEGEKGELPGMSKETFEKDLTFLIVDEVIGMSIAKYISGDKGIFEYVRFDKLKPGVLSKLGPFMDDVIAGLIGGASANMYSRGKNDGTAKAKSKKKTAARKTNEIKNGECGFAG
ncbi:MAG: alpha-ribazole phosphatase CobZ [Candidatus Methanoperedens sp.]|nr:alpha-ribazole phosphatase CobZ [Candidatus Methanoperedens sp.]MCE8425848.1 alpha-ribazole phosphatase CobZ [Candidatus Methanoperedens sp.]MCE8427634.1 alpha-ribazole phosphatase CobZ [Candidatus Methanoperedens sp.]